MKRNYTPGAGEYRHDVSDREMAGWVVLTAVAVFVISQVVSGVFQ